VAFVRLKKLSYIYFSFTQNISAMKTTLQVCGILLLALALQFNSYALKPVKAYSAIPDTMHLPFEKNNITTTDDFQLKSWTMLPAKALDKKTTLVLAYADAGNMSWFLFYAATLSKAGYTVLMFDYRGFGESTPFPTDSKMLYYNEYTADLAAAIDFARKKYPGNKTGVWCFSMGSIINTLAASTTLPDFIIGDSYVTSPIGIKEFYAGKKDIINLPPRASEYDGALLAIKAPMLIFSGTDDKVTTTASLKAVAKKKANIKIATYKGGHMAGFYELSKTTAGSEYVAQINSFLKGK
jgi:hypothetical protein